MRTLGLLGCLVWLSTATATAQSAPLPATPAQPASQDPPPPPLVPPGMAPIAASPAPVATESQVVDYRWEILLADAASIGLVFSHTKPGPTIGALVYVLGGPVIHGSNDEGARTAISLGMRLGLPLIGAVGGAKLISARSSCARDDIDCDDGSLAGAFLGFSLGVLSAMILDTALLARPHVVHKETHRTWVPQLTLTPQQKTVGVLASF
jgi:hypothetical protein